MKKAHDRSIAQAKYLIETINRGMTAGIYQTDGDTRRMDADETNMLALALEQMRQRVYEHKYEEIKARKFIPVSNEIDTGAETFAWEYSDEVGEADIITNYGDDLPMVETSGSKESRRVVALGNGFITSIQDIRRAAFAGRPLSAKKAQAARRFYGRALDSIAAIGRPSWGIPSGFLNDANVGIEPLAAAGAWSAKTSTQKLADLNALSASVVTASKELYVPDTTLLPTAQFIDVSQARMSADNSQTVLQAYLQANPWIQRVDMWNELATAGASSSARAVTYNSSPEVAELIIPQEFEVLPPQPKNLAFQTLCHGRTGGVTVTGPLGMRYMDGI